MNPWRYYCLRFADEAQCDKVLHAIGLLVDVDDGEGKTVTTNANPHAFVLDRIGTLYHPTGAEVTDPETGRKVPEMTASTGYHVNLCINGEVLLNALRPFMVVPVMPKREFAGEMATMKAQYADVPAKDRQKGFAVTAAEVETLLAKDATVLTAKLDAEARKKAALALAEYTGKPVVEPVVDIAEKPESP